ncbi:hypothetical protein [Neobacillus ginsengisoli]|uniref:Uncharacterized protein n=1 Tax=Neobacillus ginsengisoli TaxID=904295 RepID=A0ABT9XWM4_9BACI|nr:hypothetical protein [Neobacillus ginsengisoli]MDQ0199984.1 hypothetical protein [Neobacillus ginsengisoli]
MIQTRYGTYDGDSWEEYCQLLLKTKYGKEGYQEMTAHTSGDLGIEGFTRTGIALNFKKITFSVYSKKRIVYFQEGSVKQP